MATINAHDTTMKQSIEERLELKKAISVIRKAAYNAKQKGALIELVIKGKQIFHLPTNNK